MRTCQKINENDWKTTKTYLEHTLNSCYGLDCIQSAKQMNNFANDKQSHKVLLRDLTPKLHCRHNRKLLKQLKDCHWHGKIPLSYLLLFTTTSKTLQTTKTTFTCSYWSVQPMAPLLDSEHCSKIILTVTYRCVCHHCSNKCIFLCCNCFLCCNWLSR